MENGTTPTTAVYPYNGYGYGYNHDFWQTVAINGLQTGQADIRRDISKAECASKISEGEIKTTIKDSAHNLETNIHANIVSLSDKLGDGFSSLASQLNSVEKNLTSQNYQLSKEINAGFCKLTEEHMKERIVNLQSEKDALARDLDVARLSKLICCGCPSTSESLKK
jgi:hypothetical protein